MYIYIYLYTSPCIPRQHNSTNHEAHDLQTRRHHNIDHKLERHAVIAHDMMTTTSTRTTTIDDDDNDNGRTDRQKTDGRTTTTTTMTTTTAHAMFTVRFISPFWDDDDGDDDDDDNDEDRGRMRSQGVKEYKNRRVEEQERSQGVKKCKNNSAKD
jgi:hypothetical protein